MEFELFYKITRGTTKLHYPTAELYSSEFIHLNYLNNGEQDLFWNFVT